jgi:hypothetical protein
MNGGFAYGNNLGIRSAYELGRPNYIHLLNPDTQVRPGAIAKLAEFLETHPQVGIAGSSFETEQGEDWPFAFRFPTLFSEIAHGMQLGLVTRCLSRWTVARTMNSIAQPTDWICGASMMIRPTVLAAVGCLDENFSPRGTYPRVASCTLSERARTSRKRRASSGACPDTGSTRAGGIMRRRIPWERRRSSTWSRPSPAYRDC